MLQSIAAFILKVVSSDAVQAKLLDFLKTDAISYLIVNVLKISGFKAWIVTLIAEEVIEETDEIIIEPMFRQVGFYSDVLEGAVIYRKVTDATTVEDWVAELGDV